MSASAPALRAPASRRLRVAYYTHPAFWETASSLVRELSQRVELHVLVELTPTVWRQSAFDLPPRPLPAGLVRADELLASMPRGAREYWRDAASVHFVVHRTRRSLHPSSWARSREVLRSVRRIGADVLHVDDVDVSPRLALALATDPGIPLVLNVHDPEPHTGEHGWRKSLARRLAYPRASRFILHNAAQRERFRAAYGLTDERVRVVRLGACDILRCWAPEDDLSPSAPCVLFFGRLSPYKGLEVLYAAAHELAARVPGVRIVVAGAPLPGYVPPAPPVLPAPARLDLRTGYLDNRALASLLREATVVVCPYVDATQSGVALSAFGFDTPVVASAVGGLSEYVLDGRTGVLVPPRDAGALAQALTLVLCNESVRDRLRVGIAEEKRSGLSWSRVAEQVVAIYDGVRA